jgi:hypothetical protein
MINFHVISKETKHRFYENSKFKIREEKEEELEYRRENPVRSDVLRKEKNKRDEKEGKKSKKHKKKKQCQPKEKEIKMIKQKSVYKERIRNESELKMEWYSTERAYNHLLLKKSNKKK